MVGCYVLYVMTEATDADTRNDDEAPAFIQHIIDYNGGEFIGKADDGSRIGMYTDRIGDLHTDLALKNGYVVSEVHHDARKSDYKLQVQFKRLA